EIIYSSNLCVAPETEILTKDGYQTISDLKDCSVEVWNGEEWSEVIVRKTGSDQKLITVVTSTGKELTCTPYHRFYLQDNPLEKMACDLKVGDQLIELRLPNKVAGSPQKEVVVEVRDQGRVDDTYCFSEPKRHMGVFNGLLTGQCQEISLPTRLGSIKQ
ncbi:TPA: hypothetical protein N6Y90_004888, partial [Escherichia coli]|nr:hypothetical protein [Escherichia coli]